MSIYSSSALYPDSFGLQSGDLEQTPTHIWVLMNGYTTYWTQQSSLGPTVLITHNLPFLLPFSHPHYGTGGVKFYSEKKWRNHNKFCINYTSKCLYPLMNFLLREQDPVLGTKDFNSTLTVFTRQEKLYIRLWRILNEFTWNLNKYNTIWYATMRSWYDLNMIIHNMIWPMVWHNTIYKN